jgi:acetate---CoA ligase (ADP-forming)
MDGAVGNSGVALDLERDREGTPADALRAMLEPRSIAVVGASARPGGFGHRMVTEVARSSAAIDLHLVNPRYAEIDGRRCVGSLADVDGPVDLVLMGVPDAALEEQLVLAAGRGDRSAVVFGSVVGRAADGSSLRATVSNLAGDAGMAICGGGCMGFVNVSRGVRAIGYVEADPLPAGPIALVSHSGSAFSALLRSHRRLGFALAVSSGQELVTTAADYLGYALEQPETGVVALLLETMRSPELLWAGLARAAAQDVPVVALTVGTSGPGAAMVAAHSGALAGADGAWEALFDAYGVLRVRDLDELADTLELFAAGRRPRPGARGIATVHDSGAERAMVVDLADEVGVEFSPLLPTTVETLTELLDPGLIPGNPLDVWGTGADTRGLFGAALRAMADDPGVGVVALAVDLVTEFDGDESYPLALHDICDVTDTPLALLSTMHSAMDRAVAQRIRAYGVPVLEGARSGLVALKHLAAYGARDRQATAPPTARLDTDRQAAWLSRLADPTPLDTTTSFALLADYGLPVVRTIAADTCNEAVAAARAIGGPVALKTDDPTVAHKSDQGGVLLGLAGDEAVAAGYLELAGRLGPRVTVSAMAPPGLELALGIVRDPLLGPLVLVAAGGVLVELVDDHAVALPPVTRAVAGRVLGRLRVSRLLAGYRGSAAADTDAVLDAVLALSTLAVELGEALDAVDINPVLVGLGSSAGLVAVDALVVPRSTPTA